MKSISLSELTDHIQRTIKETYTDSIWVRAEINELRENNGHCFLELVEKDTSTDNITTKIRANIWASTYRMLKPYFESTTGETFRSGLKVLLAVTVDFSGMYGVGLTVKDIDPVFTVGELETRRQQIIQQLESEGVAEMNKQIPFPLLPQKIAIISSPTAAGYGDFCNQLESNGSRFAFYTKLFPAVMQGTQTEISIIQALEKIYKHIDFFDVVVIIRGGGATTDLASFDSYNLALNCAQFPLPIIAGIGHQRDNTILDRVAHTSVKTPTAAAELLIYAMDNQLNTLHNTSNELIDIVREKINLEKNRFDLIKLRLKQVSKLGINNKLLQQTNILYRLKTILNSFVNSNTTKLVVMENNLKSYSPSFMAERGYSITSMNGKRISSISEIEIGNQIKTYLKDGSFESEITKK
jgi:exodeoxyribonuclease VII large subunit